MATTLKGVQLFLNVGQGTPRPASYDVMTALSHIEVTDGTREQDGGFELTFTLGRKQSSDGTSQAYWGPGDRSTSPLPALNMNMGHFSNILSLSFSQDTQTSVNAKGTYFDPKTKTGSSIPPASEDTKEKSLARTPAPRLRTILLNGTAKYNEKEVAIAGRAALMPNLAAVKGRGEVDTTLYPYLLQAGKVVSVRGAGSLYDGSYYIEHVTHSLERGKYTQSFQLAREGVGAEEQKVKQV
jgi:hypothetical protein